MSTVTIGANTYDIYGDLAAATVYLAAKIGQTEWTAATDDVKKQGLVSATRLIQTYLASLGQDLDPGSAVDLAIQQATYELAYALVVTPTLQNASNANSNKMRVKAGSAEVEYFRPEQGGRFPVSVQSLLMGWLNGQAGGFDSTPYDAGQCNRTSLSPCAYGLTEGY